MQKILLLLSAAFLACGQLQAQCTNRCLDFDSPVSSDYVQPATSPVTGNPDFTVEARFFCTSTGNNTRRLFAFGGTNNRFEIAENGGALRFTRQPVGGVVATSSITSPNVRDNAWHHLAATRTGATVRVYLDGVQVFTTAGFSGTLATTAFRIGASVLSSGATFHWDGRIDEVRVWDVERTAAQINDFRLCWVPCTSTGLRAYYHFDQGSPDGNNPNETTLTDCTGQFNATLVGFTLTAGSNSNWTCNNDPAFLNGPCCSATFTTTQLGCGRVVFTNTTTGSFTYAWDFGDSGSSTETSPTHTYTASGTYTVTLTATSVSSGESCTVQQTIALTADNVPPTVVCNNLTLSYLTSPLTLAQSDVLQSVSDDCCPNVALMLIGQTVFDCDDVCRTRTVTLLATDCNGNTATCAALVTVNDAQSPLTVCNDINVGIGAPGTFTITPSDVDGGTTDNCPGFTLTVSPSTFGCPAQGCQEIHQVTLLATDCYGNATPCVSKVTVRDLIGPLFTTCPTPVVLSTPSGQCSAAFPTGAVAADNCDASLTMSFVMSGATTASGMGNGAGVQCNLGITTITCTASDECGNPATCVSQVTVQDKIAPTIVCPPSLFVQATEAPCGATVNWSSATAMDNCPSLTVLGSIPNGSFLPIGATVVIYTATDGSNNTAACSFQVTVVDNQSPTLICPPNTTVQGSLVNGGATATWPIPVPTDNCPGVSLVQLAGLPSGSFFPCGITTVVYQATDQSFNTQACSFTVRVVCIAEPSCSCGSFTNMTFSQQGGTPVSVACGDFIPVSCPIIGSALTLTGNFNCVGDPSCAPSNFQATSGGAQIGTGSITGNSFNWTFDGTLISTSGTHTVFLTANCGPDMTCLCILRFTVPDCPPPAPCDSISATATPIIPTVQGKDCCHSIQISNQAANLATSVNLQVLSGGSLLYTNVFPATGWSISGFSGGTSVGLSHSSGLIPVGNFTLGRICMSNFTATPQVLAVQYLNDAGQVVCSDTLTLECGYCIAIERDSIECDKVAGGYTMTFCVHVANTNAFNVNAIVLTAPTGTIITPAAFSLPNMPPGSTFCTLTTHITVPPGTHPDNICIDFTAHQKDVTKGGPPGECCTVTQCFDLPDCCTNFATATAVDTSDGKCCWKISLNQPAGTAQSVTLNVVPVPTSPVTIGGIVFDPNWNFNLALGLQSATFALTPTAALPAIVNLPTVCFDVPPGSPVPQLLEVKWSGNNNVLCLDTLEFFCRPDTDCVALTPLSLACVGGQNVYTVVVTPPFNSTLTVVPTHVAVVDVMPVGAVAAPGIFPLNSSGSTVISIPLIGTVGQVVCFKLNLYRNAVPGIFEDCCVTEDSFCVTLKDCSIIPRPPGIAIYPNPARGNFTLDFGDTGSPALGTVRVRDVAGRLLIEEEVPPGSLKHEVQMPSLASGLYFVEFAESRTRMWAEKLSVIR